MTTTKTAGDLIPGDVIQSVHGPSLVDRTAPEDGGVSVQVTIVATGIPWGDWYRTDHVFEIVEEAN